MGACPRVTTELTDREDMMDPRVEDTLFKTLVLGFPAVVMAG